MKFNRPAHKGSWIPIVALTIFCVVMAFQRATARSITISIDKEKVRVESHRFNGLEYVSLTGLVKTLGGTMEWDVASSRLRVEMDGVIWTFWGQSAMVGRADDVLVLDRPVQLIDRSPAVSITAIARLLTRHSHFRLIWDDDANAVTIKGGRFNVTGMAIEERQNGILIEIELAEHLPYESGRSEGNWINLTLHRARINENAFQLTGRNPYLRDLRTHQFDQSGQISLRLRRDFDSYVVREDEDPDRLSVLIQSRDAIQAASASVATPDPAANARSSIDRVVIDPGHGGDDAGSLGRDSDIIEKDITLAIGLEAQSYFKRRGDCDVVLTRERDTTLTIQQRIAWANSLGADLFVSLHCNWSIDPNASGSQTYFWGPSGNPEAASVAERENLPGIAILSDAEFQDFPELLAPNYQSSSAELAELIQRELESELDISGRGIDQAELTLLSGLDMPAVMVYCGFISNRKDERLIDRGSFQRDVAEAIYRGVMRFKAAAEGGN